MIMSIKTSETPATKRKINWALPDRKVTKPEFEKAIKEAEKGPFMTSEDFKARFYKWRKEKYQL
jgi:hypothetical protein